MKKNVYTHNQKIIIKLSVLVCEVYVVRDKSRAPIREPTRPPSADPKATSHNGAGHCTRRCVCSLAKRHVLFTVLSGDAHTPSVIQCMLVTSVISSHFGDVVTHDRELLRLYMYLYLTINYNEMQEAYIENLAQGKRGDE